MEEGPRVEARGVSARWVGALAATTVLALVAAAGCGDDAAEARDPSATTARPTTTVVPTTAPAEFPAATLAEVGLNLSGTCPLPWLPVYAQNEQTYPSVPPTEVRPSSGVPFDLSSRQYEPPDTDGDGVDDVMLEGVDGGSGFAIRRSDGDLVLAVDGASVGSPGGAPSLGDLDGDGRDEVLVFVADATEAPPTLHVVAGSTPPGRHDPRESGTGFASSGGSVTRVISAIGDVDRDGNDDLLLRATGEPPTVLAGPTVLAATGGALPDDTPPLAVLPDDVTVTLLLGDGHPVPVRVGTASDGSGATELTLMTEPPIVLRTDRVGAFDVWSSGLIKGFESDGHRYVLLQQQTTRSGTRVMFIWDLDDPCAGPTPAN